MSQAIWTRASVRSRPRDRVSLGIKRAFDVAAAGAGLILSAPLWTIVAAAIKLEDGGPVFYGQERSGIGGRHFVAMKFRSMIPHAEAEVGAIQARPSDPRVTAIGRLLRATAMDELPQLWNVLRGDMSMVGPRALRPAEIEVTGSGQLEALEDVPGFRERSLVRPGLTGIAQIYAPRDIARRQKFRYDLLYVRRQSLWLDIRLVASSLWITFRGAWDVDDRSPSRSLPRAAQFSRLVDGDGRGDRKQDAVGGNAQTRFPEALQRNRQDRGAATDPQPHK
jgi:lipopolysaccharide/colanic/teichoic acid biosynthesis glycosyltransferase